MSFSEEQKDFFKRGTARVIVPRSSASYNHDVAGESDSILDADQRERLFYDEKLKVYVVLQLPNCEEAELNGYLPRLNIALEVWASSESESIVRPSASSAANKDLVFSSRLKPDDDPVVLVTQGEDDQIYVNLVWETTIVIHRARIRLVEPCITITPHVTISPSPGESPTDIVLEPFTPQETNLFQPLQGAKGFENGAPFVPASRLRTVLPASTKEDNVFHFRSVPPTTIKVFPVAMTKLKYTRSWGQPTSSPLTASLDVEIIPHVNVQGTIQEVNVKLASGAVQDLTGDMLPLQCQSKDCISFLYRLQSRNDQAQKSGIIADSNLDVLTVTVRLTLQLSAECRPEIYTELVTNVDFSHPMGPPQTPLGQSLQRVNRPSSLPLHSANSSIGVSLQPALTGNHVTISFAAPVEAVKVGKTFAWKVLVVNRSPRTATLALIPLPRIQRTISQAQQYARRHASRNSSTSIRYIDKAQDAGLEDVSQAAVDENILYAMQHSGGGAATQADIVSLTSELKIGPLVPGQCHEDEIRLVAFKQGPCMVDAIRVVDLVREAEEGPAAPGVVVDIRDLPDIVSEE